MTDSSLRVVFLCNEFPPLPHGGIGVFVAELGCRLAAAGHEAVVIGVSPHVTERTDEHRSGIRVIMLPSSRLRGLDAFVTAGRIRKELSRWMDHPRVVVEGSELSLWALPSKWLPRSIVRLHGGHRFFAEAEGRRPRLLRSTIERRSLHRAGRIVGVSQYVVDRTADLVGLDAATIRVIPNGVDTDAFTPAVEIVPGADAIVFTGALCEKKGLRHLIKAVETLHLEGRAVRLLVAGRDLGSTSGEGSYLEEVLATVSPTVRASVEYLGAIPHSRMPAIYALGSIVALPSIMEAQGIAWIEAMACGKPVVASERGPGPELIVNEVSGHLCDPEDPDQIAAGLRMLLDDTDLATEMGRNARRRVLEHFSLEQTTTTNVALYQEVADCANTRA